MRTFMAAIVGLVIIGTAALAGDKTTGSITGKVVAVAADHSFVTIADKKGGEHKVHIGADTKVSADGKDVEGGVKGLKAGNTVTIAWEMNPQGQQSATHIRVVDRASE
jgi:hypothetical protein